MPWNLIQITDVRFTPTESAVIANISGALDIGSLVFGNVLGEFTDTIAAVGTGMGAAGTLPDMARPHVLNRTRWLWLMEFPTLKNMMTDGRREQNAAAEKFLNQIATRTIRVPAGDGSPADQTVLPAIRPRRHYFNLRDQEGL